MNWPSEVFGDVMVLHSPEEFTRDQAEKFEGDVAILERRKIVLDIDGTESLDSRGLTSLLNAQDTLRGLGGDVKISAASPTNRKILEITRLDRQLEVFDNVVDAVKSFR